MPNTQDPKLGRRFESIDPNNFGNIHNTEFKPLERGLWILLNAKDKLKIDYLSAEEIAILLTEIFGIKTKANSITRAFAASSDNVNTQEKEGQVLYKIMKKGEEHLIKFSPNRGINLVYIEHDKPWTGKKTFETIFSTQRGDILICDRYYGVRSLSALDKFDKKTEIKFLTAESREDAKFQRAYSEFKQENSHIEIRKYQNPDHLHDRYILTNEGLYLIGHGIKDIGDKESFIIFLQKSEFHDIYLSMTEIFNRRWKTAQIM